jgi:aldehyde:ferredoxin oxidoreductase
MHRFMSNLTHVVNATGICYFALMVYGVDMIGQFMAHVTGESRTLDELLTAGERIANMRLAFNLREGISFSDWKIPGRMIGDPPLATGPLQGITIDAKTMVSEYCETMGWDPLTGRPSREKLQELELDVIIKG